MDARSCRSHLGTCRSRPSRFVLDAVERVHGAVGAARREVEAGIGDQGGRLDQQRWDLSLAQMWRGIVAATVVVAAVMGVATDLAGAASPPGGSTTVDYSGTQQTFTVPVGVATLHVVAVGGSGGPSVGCFFPPCGGAAAQATADVAVTPGQVLYVEVGQNASTSAGGWNGGGAGGQGVFTGNPRDNSGGGGGGASDVRSVAAATSDPSADLNSMNSRLVVAAGGGGGSLENHGGSGGSDGVGVYAGGAATTSNGGQGGTCACVSSDQAGASGGLGVGGAGGNGNLTVGTCTDSNGAGGGGGGAGLYGGGGAAGGDCNQASAGGGGGASGFASVGVSSPSVTMATTSVPSVTLSWATPPANISPPANTSLPAISGDPAQGRMLTEAHGSWSNAPTSYSYQWEDCDSAGTNCLLIANATAQAYALVASDVGHTIRVQETATNAAGSGTPAVSPATSIVQVPPGTRGLPSVGRFKVSAATVALPVRCNGGPGAVCKITAALTVTERVKHGKVVAVLATKPRKIKKRIVSLGAAKRTLTAGQATVVRITLNGAGKRLLSSYHVLRTKLTVLAAGKVIAGHTITFTAPRRRQHEH
jgi:hypothetical protein